MLFLRDYKFTLKFEPIIIFAYYLRDVILARITRINDKN